jgi:hypothetical protein
MYRVSPISAENALQCVRAKEDNKAIRCNVTESEGSIVFETEWRRTTGEAASAAPQIQSLTMSSANCLNASDLAPGTVVTDGGVSLLCKRGDEAPLFSVNTTRGQCFAYGMSKKDAIELSGDVVLDRPMIYEAARVVLKPNLRMITQGFQLQIIADDRLEIEGSPRIVSFLPVQKASMEPGRSAQPITVRAKKLIGGGLSINNSGEDGGQGVQGQAGQAGPQGPPGVGRDPVTGSDNGFFGQIIQAIPKSCTGGRDGGQGGPGSPGFPGIQGASGGAAGLVNLLLPPDVEPNTAILVETNVGVGNSRRSCNGQICGGLGGPSGVGGPGGAGGPGGPGAGGTTWCGGTNAGPPGPRGADGSPGPKGPDGPTAKVEFR